MKTAGIIGGLGPETTAQFYLEVIFSCYERSKEARPPILMWSIPLEYKIEDDFLTKGEGEECYLPHLVDAAKRLQAGGADFIVIPCNSVHIFIGEVRESVKIPVLSIVEETARFLGEKGIQKIGLLATKSTVAKKLYQKPLEEKGINIELPDSSDQDRIGALLKNLVMSRYDEKDREELFKIINHFEESGLENVVLACTDLQLLTPKHDKLAIYDSMKILADATVSNILS